VDAIFLRSWLGGRNVYEIKNDEELTPYYSGIVLNNDLLQKCGFKYNVSGISSFDDDEQEGDTHYWDLRVKISRRVESVTFSLVQWGNDGDITFSNHLLRVRINYLHELQNLFFSITGYELEVSSNSI